MTRAHLLGLGFALTVGCGDAQHPPVFDAEVLDQPMTVADVTTADAAMSDTENGHDATTVDAATFSDTPLGNDVSDVSDVSVMADRSNGPDVTTLTDAAVSTDTSTAQDAGVDAPHDAATSADAPDVVDGPRGSDAPSFDAPTVVDATAADRPDATDVPGGHDASTADLPATDAMTAADIGAPDVGAPDVGAPDSGTSAETAYRLSTDQCFTFATATAAASMGRSCGDLLALAGANVDLSSSDFPTGPGGLCLLPGTYRSLAEVPSTYASCAWTGYVEGFAGLGNRGMIVRDVDRVHHYRVHIVSNALPALVFGFARID